MPKPRMTRLAPRVRVRKQGGEYRALATRDVAPGKVVLAINGAVVASPTRYTIQLDDEAHIDAGQDLPMRELIRRFPWRFTNHSCEPNTRLLDRSLVALRKIRAGEEITFNYNTTEYQLAEPFECRCGAPGCLGTIRGFRFLDELGQRRLAPLLAAHLQRRLR